MKVPCLAWVSLLASLPLLAWFLPSAWETWGPNWAMQAIRPVPGGSITEVAVLDGPLGNAQPAWLRSGPNLTAARPQSGKGEGHALEVARLVHQVNPLARVTVVSVLDGQGHGVLRDTIRGLRWAGGLAVAGLPVNPHPARVINLSLTLHHSEVGGCDPAMQQTVNELQVRQVTVVASAGNDGGSADGRTPGGCAGVITVTSTDAQGRLSSYANVGRAVTIAAPGGSARDGVDLGFGLSAWGTSLSAPLVTGALSRLTAQHPDWTPAQLRAHLIRTARPLDPNACPAGGCGAGMLQVSALLDPIATKTP